MYRASNWQVHIVCDYTLYIIVYTLKNRPVLFHTWEALLAWIDLRACHCPPTLRKITVQAIIYRIWRERNQRLHNQVSSPPQVIFKAIDRQVGNVIFGKEASKKFQKPYEDMAEAWVKCYHSLLRIKISSPLFLFFWFGSASCF